MPDEVSPGLALEGRAMVPGAAQGDVLCLDEPLSFWGGLDPETGRITDRHHPQLDEYVVGRVLVMPSGRGSSSASSALCEAIRAGTGPAAIVMAEPDEIIALGAVVADELYGRLVPVVVPAEGLDRLRTGVSCTVSDHTVIAYANNRS